jgi:hypothetical protein
MFGLAVGAVTSASLAVICSRRLVGGVLGGRGHRSIPSRSEPRGRSGPVLAEAVGSRRSADSAPDDERLVPLDAHDRGAAGHGLLRVHARSCRPAGRCTCRSSSPRRHRRDVRGRRHLRALVVVPLVGEAPGRGRGDAERAEALRSSPCPRARCGARPRCRRRASCRARRAATAASGRTPRPCDVTAFTQNRSITRTMLSRASAEFWRASSARVVGIVMSSVKALGGRDLRGVGLAHPHQFGALGQPQRERAGRRAGSCTGEVPVAVVGAGRPRTRGDECGEHGVTLPRASPGLRRGSRSGGRSRPAELALGADRVRDAAGVVGAGERVLGAERGVALGRRCRSGTAGSCLVRVRPAAPSVPVSSGQSGSSGADRPAARAPRRPGAASRSRRQVARRGRWPASGTCFAPASSPSSASTYRVFCGTRRGCGTRHLVPRQPGRPAGTRSSWSQTRGRSPFAGRPGGGAERRRRLLVGVGPGFEARGRLTLTPAASRRRPARPRCLRLLATGRSSVIEARLRPASTGSARLLYAR